MTNIFLFGFLFNGIRILTGAFIVFYMLDKGLTLLDIGIIKSLQALVMMIADIPLGYFADRKSYKASIVLAALCASIWLFLMGISAGFYGFILAEFFNALSLTLIAGAYNALLIQYAKNKNISSKKALGTSSQYIFKGMFAFSLVGAYFADYSRQYIWYISAFLMILTTLFGIVFLDNLKGEHHKQSKDYKFISDIKEMLNTFIKTPYISILFFFSLIFINIFVQYWQWIFKDFNIAITYFELGIVFSLILLSQWFASFLFTKLNIKINFYILLFLSISLLSVSIFFHPQKEISIILLCIIFYIIKYTLIHAEVLLHDNIRDKLRATYESFLSTAVRLSLLLFFYFSAALVDRFGFLSLVYIFLIFLVFYLYTLFFKNRTKKALL